ncbi:MAG: hypothetical protein SF029_02680 [bacterium]|nr:hypothetical protein [bacterium]
MFNIAFDNGNRAKAVHIPAESDPGQVLRILGFNRPQPSIFVSGGASAMSEDDKRMVRRIMAEVASFAEERKAVILDGGTESGVMQMLGDVRKESNYKFPLLGISPLGKVSYPGYKNPAEEAFLEDSHSHFVLVEGNNWGDESRMIVQLTHTISGKGQHPAVGILINGGRIAMHEVYLASTKELRLSMIVLEGSGRAADEISTAFRTGKTNQGILKAILAGGDIQLVATVEGPQAMRSKLASRFERR